MEELRDLQEIYNIANEKFSQYNGKDFVLPSFFKEKVKEINNNTIEYNMYSAIITTRWGQNSGLNIYLPNQWFYVASYFTDFYNELQKYKKVALTIVTKDRLKELNGGQLTQSELSTLNQLPLNTTSKEFLVKFITDYSWWKGAKTIDRGDFYVSPILSSAKLVNASQSFVADLCAFLADKEDLVKVIIDGFDALPTKGDEELSNYNLTSPLPLQQIFYGAPGTGKSHTIKRVVEDGNLPHIRTTFHPDSDYSTFVGAYKPTTIDVPMRDVSGHIIVEGGNQVIEKKIIYTFVPQAFLKAYVAAWANQDELFFLIIEEINRGNCAQIFGDLFQLLDRNGEGISDYPVTSDDDIRRYLNSKFSALDDTQRANIPDEILSGEKMLLPQNFHIWATMNTSDQSLFPIDSAFKRRWDWKYTPIANGNKGWKIAADGKEYDWWQFLEKINAQIGDATHSEDKKLGYYFCKPINDKTIDAETFVSKVVFYLWNDVFKDFAEDAGSIFNDEDGSVLSFNKFYTTDADGNAVVVETKVTQFLQNLGVVPSQDVE